MKTKDIFNSRFRGCIIPTLRTLYYQNNILWHYTTSLWPDITILTKVWWDEVFPTFKTFFFTKYPSLYLYHF